jgi:hypothetical protein
MPNTLDQPVHGVHVAADLFARDLDQRLTHAKVTARLQRELRIDRTVWWASVLRSFRADHRAAGHGGQSHPSPEAG